MTQATWRQFFSYVVSEEILVTGCLTQLQVQQVYAGGRSSVRQSLKETERVEAERRAFQALRYQEWKNGEASENVCI